MNLWIASALWIFMILGIVLLCIFVKKNKKIRIIGIIVCAFFSVCLTGYLILNVIFLDAIQNDNPLQELTTSTTNLNIQSITEEGVTTDQSGCFEANQKIQMIASERVKEPINLAIESLFKGLNAQESKISFPYDQSQHLEEYNKLNAEEKELYHVIIEKIKNYETFQYTVKEHGYKGMDELMNVFCSVTEDYPYYKIYSTIEEIVDGDQTVAIKISYTKPDYSQKFLESKKEINDLKREMCIFDAQCEKIVQSMPENLTTYDKYRYLASVISFIASYDYDNLGDKDVGTGYGALQSGYSICEGYAHAYELLCEKADLWCDVVSGSCATDDPNIFNSHAWNIVKLEDGTYYVDVTWCDYGVNQPDEDSWYKYFMVSYDELKKDHLLEEGSEKATGIRFIKSPFNAK